MDDRVCAICGDDALWRSARGRRLPLCGHHAADLTVNGGIVVALCATTPRESLPEALLRRFWRDHHHAETPDRRVAV